MACIILPHLLEENIEAQRLEITPSRLYKWKGWDLNWGLFQFKGVWLTHYCAVATKSVAMTTNFPGVSHSFFRNLPSSLTPSPKSLSWLKVFLLLLLHHFLPPPLFPPTSSSSSWIHHCLHHDISPYYWSRNGYRINQDVLNCGPHSHPQSLAQCLTHTKYSTNIHWIELNWMNWIK